MTKPVSTATEDVERLCSALEQEGLYRVHENELQAASTLCALVEERDRLREEMATLALQNNSIQEERNRLREACKMAEQFIVNGAIEAAGCVVVPKEWIDDVAQYAVRAANLDGHTGEQIVRSIVHKYAASPFRPR